MTRPHRDRSFVPSLGTPVEARLPTFGHTVLDNGLEVAAAGMHAVPLVAVRLVVRGGAGLDAPVVAGRASLTADLLDEGTTELTSLELAAALEALGADLSVSADWDASVLALQVPSSRLEAALELAAEIVLRPAFREAEFDRRKRRRIVALLQEQDNPATLAARAFTAHVYGPDHPYGRPAAGDLRSVRGLERDTLVRFHAAHYRPADAFLVVAGDISPARLIPTVERVFGSWMAAPPAPVTIPPAPVHDAPAVRVVDRPGAPQSELCIGHAGPARSTADYFPLIVLNTILGGSFTSRLNTRLREEKGYTYGVRSWFEFRTGPGPFAVSTAVDTQVSAAAVADVVAEMTRIREQPVATAELERARNYLALGLPRRFETVDGVADHVASVLLHRFPPDYYDRYMARVYAVTAEEVADAAIRHLDPARLSVVLAGDHDAIAADLDRLDLADVARVAPEDAAGVDHGTSLA